MRFADIACGSGSFLLGVYDSLLRYHTTYYNSYGKKEIARAAGCIENTDGSFTLSIGQRREILRNNVFGVDVDAQAVEVAQLSLALKLLEDATTATARAFQPKLGEKILPDMTKNIVCGNSLIDHDILDGQLFERNEERKLNPMSYEDKFPFLKTSGGFDAIVGNPPYGASFSTEAKKYLFEKYPVLKGQPESYEYFLYLSPNLTKENGMLAFIVPTNFIESDRAEGLREFLLKSGKITLLSNFRYKVWKDNASEPLVIIYQLGDVNNSETLVVHPNSIDEFVQNFNAIELNQGDWLETAKKRFLVRADAKLIKKIEEVKATLENVCEISQGIIVYKTREDGARNLYISEVQKDNGWKKLLDTKSSLKRYELNWGNRFLKYGNWLWCPRDSKFFEEPKIVFIRLRNKSLSRKLIGTYDEEKFYNRDNFNNVILKDKKYSLKYILALFNSNLLNYWYKAYFDNVNINPAQVKLLPIRAINFDDAAEKAAHDKMVALVEQMLDAKKHLQAARTDKDKTFYEDRCNALDRQIDKLVYRLYELTEDDIKIVEGAA